MAMAPGTPSKDGAPTDPVSQCAVATLDVMRLLNDSSPCKTLERLPRELSGKLPNIRNTGSLLHQMPSVVISLDTHLESAVQSAKLLEDVKKSLVLQMTGKEEGTPFDAESSSHQRDK